MAFNMAEAKTRITVQTEGQQSIAALENSVRDLSAEVKRFAAQASSSGNAASQMAARAQSAASGVDGAGKSAGMAGHHVQNLAFQFNDLAVQLTSAAQSSVPLKMAFTAFMQQGIQIGQIMSQAGIGFGGLVKQLGAMVGGFLVANPLFVAAAAAAGVLAGAVGLLSSEINKNSKVHVTWGDTALGVYDGMKAYLSGALSNAFKAMGVNVGDVFSSIVKYAKAGFNFMIGAGLAVPKTIMATWNLFPNAMGDAIMIASNKAINGLNVLVAKSVAILNSLIAKVDPLLSKVGMSIGPIAAPQIGGMENPYTGGLGKLLSAGSAAVSSSLSRDYLGEAAGYFSPFAEARARKRMEGDAKDGTKGAGKKAGKAFVDEFSEEAAKRWAETYKDFVGQFTNSAEMRKAMNDNDMADMMAELSAKTKARTQPGVDAGIAHFNSFEGGSLRGIQGYADQIGTMGERAFATWNKALQGTEGALVDFAMTGKLSFKSLANSIISDLVRIAIQQAIMKPLTSFLGGMFAHGGAFLGGNVLANATGNAFSGGQVTAFANGGVVTRPTLFPMAGGRTGLMGEAGAEAVMPLRRMGNGRLGVEARGGGGSNVVVNVDASGGTSVQGDQGKAGELGNAIASAVQAELVRQKRPGGLLAA